MWFNEVQVCISNSIVSMTSTAIHTRALDSIENEYICQFLKLLLYILFIAIYLNIMTLKYLLLQIDVCACTPMLICDK